MPFDSRLPIVHNARPVPRIRLFVDKYFPRIFRRETCANVPVTLSATCSERVCTNGPREFTRKRVTFRPATTRTPLDGTGIFRTVRILRIRRDMMTILPRSRPRDDTSECRLRSVDSWKRHHEFYT